MKEPTRDYHPSRFTKPSAGPKTRTVKGIKIPKDATELEARIGDRTVKLTNLKKPFWPALGITKGDLLQYYADVSPALLPHLRDRAMVMKRYPNGAAGGFFFLENAPTPGPPWIEDCLIRQFSGNML